LHTIGQIAKAAEVGVETVRFYERKGLIKPNSRTDSGYRQYDTKAIQRLRFIKKAKSTLRLIEEKITILNKMKEILNPLVDKCQINQTIDDCPILKSIEDIN